MPMEECVGEDNEKPIEVFGIHRLQQAPGTKSGYVGVRRTTSKKNPWQAWLPVKGEKQCRNVGQFRTAQEAAVAREAAKADGAHLLRSPRKQAPRNSGKRSAQEVFTPLTFSGLNETYCGPLSTANGASAPPSALPLSVSNFSSPYTSDGVQRARLTLPGQPLPKGVAAICMAVPVEQSVA